MSEFEIKRDRTKSFKASTETLEKIDELIKKSGKGATEYFEDLVMDLSVSSVIDPKDETLSPDLRKHFESDIMKLKNATNSIVSIFASQMENISVEKNQWQTMTEKKLNEKQEQIDKLAIEKNECANQLEESKQQFTELTKVNLAIEKEISVLNKRTEDQEQLIQDRTEKITDLQERINKLNENIVDKDQQLKAIEPMKEELVALKQKNETLEQEKKRLIEQHQEELKKQKETLIFQCEKETHKVETTLKEAFIQEKENIRNEVRKETEERIREFYLDEIRRKEDVAKENEEALKKQIAELQEKNKQMAEFQQQKPKNTPTKTKKENE